VATETVEPSTSVRTSTEEVVGVAVLPVSTVLVVASVRTPPEGSLVNAVAPSETNANPS